MLFTKEYLLHRPNLKTVFCISPIQAVARSFWQATTFVQATTKPAKVKSSDHKDAIYIFVGKIRTEIIRM